MRFTVKVGEKQLTAALRTSSFSGLPEPEEEEMQQIGQLCKSSKFNVHLRESLLKTDHLPIWGSAQCWCFQWKHLVTTGSNTKKENNLCVCAWFMIYLFFIFIYFFVLTLSELIKAGGVDGGRVTPPLPHITTHKNAGVSREPPARWLWTPAEKITWCSALRLS